MPAGLVPQGASSPHELDVENPPERPRFFVAGGCVGAGVPLRRGLRLLVVSGAGIENIDIGSNVQSAFPNPVKAKYGPLAHWQRA